MLMIENFDEPISIEFVSEAKESSSADIYNTWKHNAAALMMKAQIMSKNKSSNLRSGTFSNAINLDKLLREHNSDSGQMSDAMVKSMFATFVFNHLRLNFSDVSPNVVRRVVKKFVLDQKFCDIHSEAISFLREVVEFVPPLFSDARLFWIDVFVDSSRVLCFNRGLQLFGQMCMRIFCQQSIEYCECLLDILEIDYAGIHLLPIKRQIVPLKADPIKHRPARVRIISPENLNSVPLALLLICETNKQATHYWESNEWIGELAQQFSNNDSPRWRCMYGRLIGLLLDVNAFVYYREFYLNLDITPLCGWHFLPIKLLQAVGTLRDCIENVSATAMTEFEVFCAERAPFVCGILKIIRSKSKYSALK